MKNSERYKLSNWLSAGGPYYGKPGCYPSVLVSNYNDNIGFFLEALERADSSERGKYYEEVYETLYCMARNNNQCAIERVFALCPGLDTYWGHMDGITPLGEAIASNCQQAIQAFLNCGFDIESCCSGIGDWALDLADNDNELIMFLVKNGADISLNAVYSQIVYYHNYDLAKEMILKGSSFCYGLDDVKALLTAADSTPTPQDPDITITEHNNALEFIRSVVLERCAD